MNHVHGLPHDFRLVLHEIHPDSYELTKVLLATASFDGELKLLTAGWERMLGFGHGELAGKMLLDLMGSDPRSAASAVVAILGGMDKGPVDLTLRCRDGGAKRLKLHRRYARREQIIYIVAEEIDCDMGTALAARGASSTGGTNA